MKIELYIPRTDVGTKSEYRMFADINCEASPTIGAHIRYDGDLYQIKEVFLGDGRVGVLVKKIDARANTFPGIL